MQLRKLKSLIPDRHPLRLLWHRIRALAAAIRYGFPARSLTVIGVTGTDGKTTTVSMIAHILKETGYRYGAASTTFFEVNGDREINETHKTSIDPSVLQKFLRKLSAGGCTHAVLEVSSHGLVQHRSDFTWPSVAAITNTTPEHLDYHGDMATYRRDKGKLFGMLRGKGTKVLNRDDGSFAMYAQIPSQRTITYAERLPAPSSQLTAHSHFCLSDIEASPTSTSATLHVHPYHLSPITYHLALPIPGTFNLENALSSICCCLAVGIKIEDSIKALQTFQPIPGRLERLDEGQPFLVFVDFAVSAASYEKTLHALRSMIEPGKRVLVLCGCCGNRMREKRREVGRICSELADVVVVAGDETYGEDPREVLEEVWAGVNRSACDAHKVFDRREAVRFLLSQAHPGDAAVICGMGPFTTMMTLEGEIPWDEREVAREVLREGGRERGESSGGEEAKPLLQRSNLRMPSGGEVRPRPPRLSLGKGEQQKKPTPRGVEVLF